MYAELVERGAMSAHEIEYAANVPSGRLYSVLESLENRGAVIKTEDSPRTFDAVNPRKILRSAIDELDKDVDKALATAEPAFEKRLNSLVDDQQADWVVKGSNGITAHLRSLIKESKDSIMISDDDISWLGSKDYNVLKHLASSKVNIRLISSPRFKEQMQDLHASGVQARFSEWYLPILYL